MSFLLAWLTGPLLLLVGGLLFRQAVSMRLKHVALGREIEMKLADEETAHLYETLAQAKLYANEAPFSIGNLGVPDMSAAESVAVFGGLMIILGAVLTSLPILIIVAGSTHF